MSENIKINLFIKLKAVLNDSKGHFSKLILRHYLVLAKKSKMRKNWIKNWVLKKQGIFRKKLK